MDGLSLCIFTQIAATWRSRLAQRAHCAPTALLFLDAVGAL